jgi:hypothetical protein
MREVRQLVPQAAPLASPCPQGNTGCVAAMIPLP